MMGQFNEYTKGDLFKVVIDNDWFETGSIIKLVTIDAKGDGAFALVAGGYKELTSDVWYMTIHDLLPVWVQPKPEVFEPFTFVVDSLEKFEILKSIMHLRNKVGSSSFYDLDWTPESFKVSEFMRKFYLELDGHHSGWSKYKEKGED